MSLKRIQINNKNPNSLTEKKKDDKKLPIFFKEHNNAYNLEM